MNGAAPSGADRRRLWRIFLHPDTARISFLSATAALLGLACGAVAWGFEKLIGFFTNLLFLHRIAFDFVEPSRFPLGAMALAVPVAGGLVVGLFIRYGSEKLKGDGIPEALEAILTNESRISPRIAVMKPLCSALTIGSGGPFGAEGPIIQTGGAVGSVLGQFLHVTAAERRILLAAGAAAGLAATYGTPIAAVILAIELLLFEFRTRSFIPLVIATTVATAFRFRVIGSAAMFSLPPARDFGTLPELALFFVLGNATGLFSVVVARGLYECEEVFDRLRIPVALKPALGGLAVGALALLEPRILGPGYDEIRGEMLGRFAIGVLLVLLAAKLVAWWAALGSGQAGGVLAPMLLMGGAVGGVFGALVHQWIPSISAGTGVFALAAAASVFGATTRATFAAIIFGMELTRSFASVLPLMITCVAADAVCHALESHSILTYKLAERGLAVAHDLVVDPMRLARVSDVMVRDVRTVRADMAVGDLLELYNHPGGHKHQGYPVLDADGGLLGIVTRTDLLRPGIDTRDRVRDIATRPAVVCSPGDSIEDAIGKMAHREVGHLPVVDEKDPRRLVGILSRSDCLKARQRRVEEETRRGRGSLAAPLA